MSILAQVPELYEGGFWYAVPAVIGDDGGYGAPLESYCAGYGEIDGIVYAIIRVPVANTAGASSIQVSAAISAAAAEGSIPSAEKFYARIGGK